MREFILSNITLGNKAPFSKRSLEHINSSIAEASLAHVKSLGDATMNNTDIYVMAGCVITGSYPGAITWTKGLVYYNGNCYEVDSGGVTIAALEMPVFQFVTTYITGDPATFSDASSNNFHGIKKVTIASGLTGSGLDDYEGCWFYHMEKRGATTVFIPLAYSGLQTALTVNSASVVREGFLINFSVNFTATFSGSSTDADMSFDIADVNSYPSSRITTYNSGNDHVQGTVSASVGYIKDITGTAQIINVSNDLRISVNKRTGDTTWKSVVYGSYIAETAFGKL